MEDSQMYKKLLVTAAVNVIAGNVDLLSEILLRLPARSLIRFSIVCKLWCSIITGIQFRLSHCRSLAFSNALSPSGIYFYNYLTYQKIISLPLADNATSLPPLPLLDQFINSSIGGDTVTEFKVTQSCNGLLMCIFTASTTRITIKKGIVYNPANGECCLLPTYKKCDQFVYYNLISDPSEPPYYKVLCLTRMGYGYSDIDVSVYVPKSYSWRSCCHFSAPRMAFDSGVFWNGAIYWISKYSSFYFDVKSEKVAEISMPPRPQGGFTQKIRYFGEWGGHLHLIQVQSRYAKKFNVLELDKDTWKWSVKYHVHLAQLISTFPEMVQQTSYGIQYAFSILSVIRGEKEEDSVLLLTIPGKVVAYNLVLKTAKVVRELPGEVVDTLFFNQVCAYQYTESLVPVSEWTVGPEKSSYQQLSKTSEFLLEKGDLLGTSSEYFFKDA
ncbi:F-box protein At5g07610-like isoform X1 [Lycium ferocissimum]|uniref:F-box protein At5g07610-like isoform X1 n=1 Tax=Lycium ferocissimum TaxID=112874 RepID=UPI002814F27E|nr:F-box protein At5g07610-like isoform X1 [Lycium ferocissimum]